jgi:GT2 family glycosyltransferase
LDICIGVQGNQPTGEFLQHLMKDPHLRIIKKEVPSTTATLNHCISSSSADIVLLLDDDAIPNPGWLEAHLNTFETDPNLAYSCGREIRTSIQKSTISKLLRMMIHKSLGIFFSPEKKIQGYVVGWICRNGLLLGNFFLPGKCLINSPRGCNMGIRRVNFLEIGGFNEEFRGNAWGFEAEFGLRMADMSKLGQYNGDAVVQHLEVSSGGSREKSRQKWFDDFLFNNKILITRLGKKAWIGSLPRLIKNYIKMRFGR